jgi:hypothetical protein
MSAAACRTHVPQRINGHSFAAIYLLETVFWVQEPACLKREKESKARTFLITLTLSRGGESANRGYARSEYDREPSGYGCAASLSFSMQRR